MNRLTRGKVTGDLRGASGFAAAASVNVRVITRDEGENIENKLQIGWIPGSVEFDVKGLYA